MTDISEEDIKIRAYALWEADGNPDGSHDAHWLEALRQLTEEAETADSGAASTTPSKLSIVSSDTVTESTGRKRNKTA